MLASTLNATKHNDQWQWQTQVEFKGGALYVDPLYLEAGPKNILLDAQGNWDEARQHVQIKAIKYRHAEVGELSGRVRLGIKLQICLFSCSYKVASMI